MPTKAETSVAIDRSSADATRTHRALQSLNVFMADMQAGVGRFPGLFLQQQGWATGPSRP
ncbi:MAG: hypothetical protein ABI240_15795 [Sphingomonas sp.]